MVLIASAFRLRNIIYGVFLVVCLLILLSTTITTTWGSSADPQGWRPTYEKGEPGSDWELQLPGEDGHPINRLIKQAWNEADRYTSNRSKTFKQAVESYRSRFGRHPPPGYKQWYKFARRRKIYNIDDFDQINGDLRPFWAVKPSIIRNRAAHAVNDPVYGNSILAIRNGHIYLPNEHWRPEQFIKLLRVVAKHLPDMDIPLNNLDQPRVTVPWEELQEMLRIEETTRSLGSVEDRFTKKMSNYWVPSAAVPDRSWVHWFGLDRIYNELAVPAAGNDPAPDYDWQNYRDKQYMDVCAKACPPDSYARNGTLRQAEASYKDELGIVTNFNLSTDVCTVGPQLANLHGMMYASTSLFNTVKLVPIFSECKVSVNNDILYPANMYYKRDRRYEYTSKADVRWQDKNDMLTWRGVTAGGTTYPAEGDKWKQMHRQRFVLLTNSSELAMTDKHVSIPSRAKDTTSYTLRSFEPANFASQHADTGFTEKQACLPDCDFYDAHLAMVKPYSFAEIFRSKYLVDIDGMSFSGRWRAFLQSRSLGIKATIFREWHDSRLIAWKHFVPMDNRFDDLYSILTYFIGIDQPNLRVPRHDEQAHLIAQAGREWAAKVLRREDIEIYLYRLLLEYGRIIDDNRDHIGFFGDGGQEMERFDQQHPAID